VTAPARTYGPPGLAAGLAVLAGLAVAVLIATPVAGLWNASPGAGGAYDVERMVLLYATLPRLAIAALCGAGLAASGAILQQVLRNPLASPTTLGVDAGARLALTLATLLMPSLLGFGRDLVALAGSAASTLLVFFLVRRRGLSAMSIVLAGLVVSLYCGALSAMLVLMRDRVLSSLFIWGNGSLAQQSWDPTVGLGIRLVLVAVPLTLMLRPMSLLDLGDDSVRALGLSVTQLRAGAVALAAALSAFVTSAVGVVGFVGLVAPALARVAGARGFRARLLWSTLIGALLLLLTDATVQLATGASAEFVPTGAVTAVLGSPLLLVLLPRLSDASAHAGGRFATAINVGYVRRRLPIAVPFAVLLVLMMLSIIVGRGPDGRWEMLSLAQWDLIGPWRAPRILAAGAAGALLGVAGTILQRVTGNEMASPEVLGVGAGSILGVALSLFLFDTLAPAGHSVMATAGGALVLAAILVVGRRSRFAPERVLLAGVALNALIDSVVGVLSATGDPRALVLLGWMSGSTSGTTGAEAWPVAAAAGVLVAASLLTARWLMILPLGDAPAAAVGVPLARARFTLMLLAALMTATATLVIGPLTFVGLMAPHIVLAMGIRRPGMALAGAAFAGASVMSAADWLARMAVYPIQLPTGLVAAMVGAPFLMLLLHRRRPAA
jgi:iron complex transport system permease protein